jgi:formate hydrogenlyase subunit 4
LAVAVTFIAFFSVTAISSHIFYFFLLISEINKIPFALAHVTTPQCVDLKVLEIIDSCEA